MREVPNSLKTAIAADDVAIGVWCSLASALTTEVVACSGADWLLIDGEHSPNDLRSIMAQLQAAGQYPLEAVVRLPSDDPVLVKQHMDAGARSLMVPNIQSVEQAERVVAATQYAPRGMRGFSVAHRANRFGRINGYHENARTNQLLVLQIESEAGVAHAPEIAAVEGVDVLFIGPGDLSTNMGAMWAPGSELVQSAIYRVADAAKGAGKATGILAPNREDAKRYMENGFRMVAVGSDLGLLAKGSDELVGSFKGTCDGS